MSNYLRRLDWWLICSVLLISGVGLVTTYNIGSIESLYFFKRQFIFVILGLITMVLISFFDCRMLKNYSYFLMVLYFIGSLSLFAVLFSGATKGASSWFYVGPISIEPIEFVKLILIIFFAKYFSLRHIEMYRVRHLVVSGIYLSLPVIMTLLQPDFGSAMVLCGIWLGIIMVTGIKIRHLIVLFLIIILLLVGGWSTLLRPYQKQRLLTFLNPKQDPYGSGYHVNQSLITIGSGGVFGQENKDSLQSALEFLPEQYTDFIFAAWAEQAGLMGVIVLLLLFLFMFWRMIKIALSASNNFSRLCAIGIVTMLSVQLIINIGMNMAIMPVTGLTLPLVSYGGSSLLSVFMCLGVLQSIRIRNNSL